MSARLELLDGSVFHGKAFGATRPVTGEVVFNTGMVGYPESLTDPSYSGQILILTYPLVGNYGVPQAGQAEGVEALFESDRIQIRGLVISSLSSNFSHWNADSSLHGWLSRQRIPAIYDVDTRLVTQKLRDNGAMLGRLLHEDESLQFEDPNLGNLVSEVSVKEPVVYGERGSGQKHVTVIDCGCKNGILRALMLRGVSVKVVPWDWPADEESGAGVFISNGPGDPTQCPATVDTVRRLMKKQTPLFGICLGSQILALAAGAETYKLKYGHRSQNQPCVQVGTKRCFITSQNHGYAVKEETLPADWLPWFFNANDGSNEGILHRAKPFYGVQFHPEASPGPADTDFLFDEFLARF